MNKEIEIKMVESSIAYHEIYLAYLKTKLKDLLEEKLDE